MNKTLGRRAAACLLALALGCFALFTGCSRGKTIGNTTYAPGFSEARFAKIKTGMTEAQVERVAGKPLEIDRYEDFTYSIHKSSRHYVSTEVAYCNGEVIDWDTRLAGAKGVRARMTRREVEHRLGSKGKRTRYDLIWKYSDFDFFEGEVRWVWFDAKGRVRDIDHYTSRD